MRNLGPPQTPAPSVAQVQAGPTTKEGFNFGFFKPKKDARRKYIVALIVLLIIVIAALSIVFPVLSHNKQAEHLPLPQNTTISTTLVSTDMVSTTLLEVSTTTQVTTQTTTLTSLLPNPTSVNKCWDLLSDICANTTQVPSDTSTGAFGDCVNVFGFFYCGVIQDLEAQHIFIIPADDSPFCFGMRGFCSGIHLGDPLDLHSSNSMTTSKPSGIQVIPVTNRGAVEATTTGVAVGEFVDDYSPYSGA